jgi:tRNA nucleotidyltransferase/poly(A) polymerase
VKDLMDTAIDYLRKLSELGYDAYIVGGAVRDKMRGVEVSDVDVATNCPMNVLSKEFSTHVIGKSKDFGIFIVLHKGEHFETAQFRSDSNYTDGRRPDKVEIVGDIYKDLIRRDFTVNALAMDKDGLVVDIVNGEKDIKNKVIRAVGDPMVRFGEDHLRMMRVARFGAMEGFTVERDTKLAVRRLSHLIHTVSKERIRMELVKAASKCGMEFSRFITLLDQLKLLSKILPEVHALKYFKQDMEHHPEGPTVLMHTLRAVELLGKEKLALSKIATLFHDVGKAICFDDDTYGYKMRYPRHEHCSEFLVDQICERLKFSIDDTCRMMFVAANHMKFHNLLEMKPSKVARLVSNCYFDTLIDACYADEFSRKDKFIRKEEWKAALDRIYEIKERWENRITNNKISLIKGETIMEVLGIKPGRMVGQVKRRVEDAILNNNIDPDDTKAIHDLILRSFLMKEESND